MNPSDPLRATDIEARLAAIEALNERGTATGDELDALIASLGSEHKLIQRRAAETFAALHASGVDCRPVLMAALRSVEPRRRWGAAYALALLGTPPRDVLPVLLGTMGFDDGDMRWAAAEIVVRMKADPYVIPTLLDVLRAGNSTQRKMAAYCLRDLGIRFPGVEEALTQALDYPDVNVRLAAMSALARLACDRGSLARRLLADLRCGDERIRRAAAATLGMVGERAENVIDALRAALSSPDAALRRAAERSLRLLRG